MATALANQTQNYSGAVGAPGVLVPNLDPRLNLPWSPGPNANMMQVYGTPVNMGLDSNYMQAANSITMSDLKSSDVARSGFFVMTGFLSAEQRGRWIFRAAKPRRRTNMHHIIQILEARASQMVKAPEGTAPPLVQIAETSRVSSMERFHQGAKEFWDVLMTPAGLAQWKFKLAIMVRSAWITAHTVVLTAFLALPDYYQKYFKAHGTPYSTVADSLLVPTTVFAALNMNSQGIYTITQWVLSLMNKKPNMAVVAANTVAYITKNKSFETDASRRGLDAATNNLIQGDGVRTLLSASGIELYEDNPTNIDNTYPFRNDLLRMHFAFGRCFVLDNSAKIYKHDNTLDVKAMYSPGTASMDMDGYKRWKPEDLIKYCHVWDSTLERYSNAMKEYLAEIESITNNGGHPGELPSPYFYRVGGNPAAALASDGAYRKHAGFALADLFGDQELAVRSVENDIAHGESARDYLKKKLKGDADKILGDYDHLFEELKMLYSPPSLNPSVIGMVNGTVVANVEQGKVMVRADPLTGAPEILPRPNAAGNLTADINGVTHVLLSFDMDEASSFTLSNANLVLGGITGGGVDASNSGRSFTLGDRLVDSSTPGAYLWVKEAEVQAVLDLIRPAKVSVSIAGLFNAVPPGQIPFFETTAAKVALALRAENIDPSVANTLSAAATENISAKYYLRGFRARSGKRVPAPALPYGWSTIAHANRLVDLKRIGIVYGDPTTDTAIKRMYKRLERGRDAFDKVHKELTGLYKYLELNATYCPSYISTGMIDIDAKYAFAFTRDDNKLPLYSIAPSYLNDVAVEALGVVTLDVANSRNTDQAAQPFAHTQTLGPQAVEDFLVASGYNQIEAANLANDVQFREFIQSLTSSEFMEPTVADTLRDPATYQSYFDFFKNSELGASLNTALVNRPNNNVVKGNKEFSQFFEFVIRPELRKGKTEDIARARAMFANVYSLLASSYTSRKVLRKLDETYLQKIVNLRASRKHTYDADSTGSMLRVGAAGALAPTSAIGQRDLWVNSRLSLDPILFQRLEQIVTSKSANATDAVAYSSIPVRPANPANPNGPIFTYLLNAGGMNPGAAGGSSLVNSINATASTAIGSFKGARAFSTPTSRSSFQRFVFSSSRNFAPLLPHTSSAAKYRRVDDATAALQKQVAMVNPTPFGNAAKHVPRSRLPITEDPSYAFVQYEDERGRPLPELSIFAKKNNLIYRIEKIFDSNIDDIVKQCALLMNFCRCCGAADLRFLECDVLPVNSTFIIMQPCIDVITTPVMYIAASEQVAEFGYNWDHNAVSYDNEHKKVMAHITIWMACDVIDATAFFIAKHAKVEQYVRGMDNSILKNVTAYDSQRAFKNDPAKGLGSCLILSAGGNYTRETQLSEANPLPMNGKHLQKMLPFTYQNPGAIFGESSAPIPGHGFMRWLFDLDIVFGNQHVDETSYMTSRRHTYVSGELFHGKMLYYNESGQVVYTVNGTGYLKDLDPPFRPILTGQIQGNVWKD